MTKAKSSLQTENTMVANVPEDTHLTVLNLQKSGTTTWLWVTYFGQAGWIKAENIILANDPYAH